MEVSNINPIIRIAVLALALASSIGCERVLELGLSSGVSSDIDAGNDTGDEDAGNDAGDTDTDTEPPDTDDPDGSTDGSPYDGAT
jgi:hypothetical protein